MNSTCVPCVLTASALLILTRMSVFDWDTNVPASDGDEIAFSDQDAICDSGGHYVHGALVMAMWNLDQIYYPCKIVKYQRTNNAYEVIFLEDSVKALVKEEFVVVRSTGIWRYCPLLLN